MPADGWVQIRVRKSTHLRLQEIARRLLHACELGLVLVPDNSLGVVPLDFCIKTLLDRADRQRQRNKQWMARRSKTRAGKKGHPATDKS